MSVPALYITERLKKDLGIPPETEEITVCAGQKSVQGRLLPCLMQAREYGFSPDLKQALQLGNQKRLLMKYEENTHRLRVGSFVGIITTALPLHDEGYEKTSFFAELLFLSRISRNMAGCFFVFRPSDVCWFEKTVRGCRYTELAGWQSDVFPLPDVIYDRIPSRRVESSSLMKEFREQLQKQGEIKYFNSSYLNKWTVHQKLTQVPHLQVHLPETRILDAENLTYLLEKYGTLFAKPANGSLGRGIIQIQLTQKGMLSYTLYRKGKIRSHAANVEEFLYKTRKFRRGWTYIIQQGLSLQTFQGNCFDIRVIFQKDGDGNWKVSKKFFRMAPKGSSISNLSSGGHVEPFRRLARKLLDGDKKKVAVLGHEIENLCRMIAEKLEEDGCFGELGLDLGLGTDGRLWLIEVNSKPRKTTESNMSMKIVTHTFQRPLSYASFLAGF